MIGSIIGDTVGSIYEFRNIKTKDFPFFEKEMEYTDDSILTFATADWLMQGGESARFYAAYAQANRSPMGGYGSSFLYWVHKTMVGEFEPYNSCGNGSAMRVGPVGWAYDTKEETLAAAKASAECTHNHPEGIKGAQATALIIFMARKGASKQEIQKAVEEMFGYDLSMSIDDLRPLYSWNGVAGKGNGGICQDSVPQAIMCALQATDFEDAVRNAISIGGDSDTIGCITGSIAEALYGVPRSMYEQGMSYLPTCFKELVLRFEEKYGNNIID